MNLNARESQRAKIVRIRDYTKAQTFNQANLIELRERMRLLRQALDNYNDEHAKVLENVQANDMDVQNDAAALVDEIYMEAFLALETRMDEIVDRFEAEALNERENERQNRNNEQENEQQNEPNQDEEQVDENNGAAGQNAQNANAANGNGGRDNRANNGQFMRQPRMARDEYLLDHFKPPKFNGSYAKWNEWRSAFDSMVHSSTLSDHRKMYLLKQCIEGSAERVLSGWQVVGEYYASAYETLCAVFENKYRITMSHLDELFGMPKLEKETYDGLRGMIDTTNSVTRQLRASGYPVEAWDEVIVYVLITRMAPRTLIAWEEKDEHNEMPKCDDIMKFLAQRARSQLNQDKPSTSANWQKGAENSNRQNGSNVQNRAENGNRYTGTKPKQNMGQQNDLKRGVTCNNCQMPHPMFRCSRFQALTVKERYNRVRELGLCNNCFSANHRAGSLSCKAGPCKRCDKGQNHNALLCYTPIQGSNAIAANNWQQPSHNEQFRMHNAQQNPATFYQPSGPVAQLPQQTTNQTVSSQNYHMSGNQSSTNFH